MTTDFSKDPHYRLEDHRWHALDHPEPSERRFQTLTARGIGASNTVLTRQHFGTTMAEVERTYDLASQGNFLDAAHRNPDAAARLKRFYETKIEGKVTPDDVREGMERIYDFAPKLQAQVLEGAHGDQPYSGHLARMMKALKIKPMEELSDNASFIRVEAGSFPNPGETHSIELSPWTVGRFNARVQATETDSDFYGAPYMISPEGLFAHEYGHALDYWLTNLKDPNSRHHFPELARRGQYAGLKMAHGLEWQHVHNGLMAYATSTPSGVQGIPTLPQPLTRLHYPTVGLANPSHPIYQATSADPNPFYADLAKQKMFRVSEWPTVTTELRMHAPEALDALDAQFGRDPLGRGAKQIVDDFWGFQWPKESNPEAGRILTTMLRETLAADHPERGILGMEDASSLIHPNPLFGGDKRVRGYAGADMQTTTKFGDPLVNGRATGFTPDPAKFARIYHDLRTFSFQSDGVTYLNVQPLTEKNLIGYAPPGPAALARLVLASYRSGVAFDPRDVFALETLPATPPRW